MRTQLLFGLMVMAGLVAGQNRTVLQGGVTYNEPPPRVLQGGVTYNEPPQNPQAPPAQTRGTGSQQGQSGCPPALPGWVFTGKHQGYCHYNHVGSLRLYGTGRVPSPKGPPNDNRTPNDNPGYYPPPYYPPSGPGRVPPPTYPYYPPPGGPGWVPPPATPPTYGNPPQQGVNPTPQGTYLDGIRAGFADCSKPFEVLWRAFQSAQKGDFITAAQVLGATDSAAGLRFIAGSMEALWKDISETQAIDTKDHTLTPYEIGRRQAARVCTWALIPSATECAGVAGACATKAVARRAPMACTAVVQKLQQLWRKKPLRIPGSPLFRGMLLGDENLFKQLAATSGKTFIVRDSNPIALRWVGRGGYKPKPIDIKGKTLKPQDLPGVPKAEADKYLGLASAKGMSLEDRSELLAKGYRIASPGEHEIIRGPDGSKFYSDIDVHGVYNPDGTNGWTPELQQKLECDLFDRGVQHDPHDNWPDRNNRAIAKGNYGPQIGNGRTVTAVFPDGTMLQATTLAEMKQIYQAIGADFRKIYPGF